MKYEFDIKPVVYMVDSKKERAFKKAGAFIRADARQSIRVSIRNSKPGEPPKAKRRTFKNSIRFAADKESVVTGPVRAAPANSTPHVLEAGGWRSDKLWKVRARWGKANPEKARENRKNEKARRKQEAKATGTRYRSQREIDAIRRKLSQKGVAVSHAADGDKVVKFYIARRPYMEPALTKNKPKVLMLLGE